MLFAGEYIYQWVKKWQLLEIAFEWNLLNHVIQNNFVKISHQIYRVSEIVWKLCATCDVSYRLAVSKVYLSSSFKMYSVSCQSPELRGQHSTYLAWSKAAISSL